MPITVSSMAPTLRRRIGRECGPARRRAPSISRPGSVAPPTGPCSRVAGAEDRVAHGVDGRHGQCEAGVPSAGTRDRPCPLSRRRSLSPCTSGLPHRSGERPVRRLPAPPGRKSPPGAMPATPSGWPSWSVSRRADRAAGRTSAADARPRRRFARVRPLGFGEINRRSRRYQLELACDISCFGKPDFNATPAIRRA